MTVPTLRSRKNETSVSMEIEMAAKEAGKNASQEGDQRIVDLALQAVYEGTGKGTWSFGKAQSWNEKGGKGDKDGGKNSWQKGSGKKGSKGQEKGDKEGTRTCWTCGKTGHVAAWCKKATICTPSMKMAVTTSKESADNEEDLQAWCLLEENENEQWQEVISRRDKQRAKKANLASLLSVESSHNSSPMKILEVKDRWVEVRVTIDSGAVGHVMLETMFPRVKLERKRSPKKFVAASGKQIKGWGEKNIPLMTNEGIQRCMTFRCARCCQTSHLNAKGCPSRKHCRAG